MRILNKHTVMLLANLFIFIGIFASSAIFTNRVFEGEASTITWSWTSVSGTTSTYPKFTSSSPTSNTQGGISFTLGFSNTSSTVGAWNSTYGGVQMGTSSQGTNAATFTFQNPWGLGSATYQSYTKITSIVLVGNTGDTNGTAVSSTIGGVSTSGGGNLSRSTSAVLTTITMTPASGYDTGIIVITVNEPSNVAWYFKSIAITAEIPNIVVTGVSISPESATILGIGNTQQITATISPANATNQTLTWSSSNNNIATVNSSGLVTAVAVGSATITATTQDGSFTDTSEITIEAVTQVTSISVSLGSSTVASGATTQATETVSPAEATNKTVTWSSSNTAIATVNSSGLVTANSSGIAGVSTIRATATDGSGVFGEAELTVSPVNVSSVTLSPETATITGLGNTQQLTATISPNNATNKNLTWTSNNTGVATVNASGLVTSVASGTATITVTTEDGSFTDTSEITVVYVPVSSISLSTNSVTIYTIGTYKTTTLIATISPGNATNSNVTWTSSSPSVATVNSSGLVTGLTVGSTTITVTSSDNNSITATATVTVIARTVTNVSIKTPTTKTSFIIGENIYSPSLALTIDYNDLTSEDVTSGYSLSGYNSKQLGSQTVTISYPGYSGTNPTYSVFVTNVGSATPVVATDLFISEYIEGNSNNKAIEIFNGTGAGVVLTNYKLRVHVNGATSTTDISLGTSTLANNSTFVIANPSANASITSIANSTTGSINFNGDDAVSLYKVSTATNIDVIGTIGVDPGTEFTGQAANGDATTLDKTITRTANVYQPSSTFKFQEWNVSSTDTISNLGSHTFSPLTSAEQSQAFADYLEQFATCTLSGPDSVPTLVAEYNAMTASSKTAFASITIDDYDNDAYLSNGSTYSGLTRNSTVNALTKLNKIKDLYNAQNPGNTQTLSARINTGIQMNSPQQLFIILISILMLSLYHFINLKFIKKED